MKVLHVAKQFAPSVGGMEEAVYNLVKHQREHQGIDASVVTLDRLFSNPSQKLPRYDRTGSVPITRVPWIGSRRYPLAPSVLARLLNADLVHVHGIDFFFDYLAATKLLHRKPLVATTHGGYFHTKYASSLKKYYFRTITKFAALFYGKIVGSSEADTRAFAKICPPDKLVCIENGVNLTKFAGAASRKVNQRMIYFGRFASHKGIKTVLALLAALRESDSCWELCVAGGPGDLNREHIISEAARLEITSAVKIVDSPSDAELRNLISQCSYFVCASSHEGFGLAAVEAMSAGLIPILSPIPTFVNFIAKARWGILLESKEIQKDANLIISSHRHFQENGDDARIEIMRAAASYGWENASNLYAEVYRSVLG